MQNTDTESSIFLKKLERVLKTEMEFGFKPDNVCMICSTKSIIAGYLVSDYANECCNIPTTVTDDVRIPGWIDKNTLVILMTENNQLHKLVEKLGKTECKIVTITDFDVDDLRHSTINFKVDSKENYEYLGEILGYLFLLFDKMGMISKSNVLNILPMLDEKRTNAVKWFVDINPKNLSKKNIVIVYPPNFRSTATLWKFTFYNRLKQPTLTTEYPEFNHNEIVGWCMSPKQSKDYVMVFIVDDNAIELLTTITESMIKILEESKLCITKVRIDGKNNLEKNLIGFAIGEAVPKHGGKQ